MQGQVRGSDTGCQGPRVNKGSHRGTCQTVSNGHEPSQLWLVDGHVRRKGSFAGKAANEESRRAWTSE